MSTRRKLQLFFFILFAVTLWVMVGADWSYYARVEAEALERSTRAAALQAFPRRPAFPGAFGGGANALSTCRDSAYLGPNGIPLDGDEWPVKIHHVAATGAASLSGFDSIMQNTADKQYDMIWFDVGGRHDHRYQHGNADVVPVKWKNCVYIAGQSAPGDYGFAIMPTTAGARLFRVDELRDFVVRYMTIAWDDSASGGNVLGMQQVQYGYFDHLEWFFSNDQNGFGGALPSSDSSDSPANKGNGTTKNNTWAYGLGGFSGNTEFTMSSVVGANGVADYTPRRRTFARSALGNSNYRMPLMDTGLNDETINVISFNWAGGREGMAAKAYIYDVDGYVKGPLVFARNHIKPGNWSGDGDPAMQVKWDDDNVLAGWDGHPELITIANYSDSILTDTTGYYTQYQTWDWVVDHNGRVYLDTDSLLYDTTAIGTAKVMDNMENTSWPYAQEDHLMAVELVDSLLIGAGDSANPQRIVGNYQGLTCDGNWQRRTGNNIADTLVKHMIYGTGISTESNDPAIFGGFNEPGVGTSCLMSTHSIGGLPRDALSRYFGTYDTVTLQADHDSDGWLTFEEIANGTNPLVYNDADGVETPPTGVPPLRPAVPGAVGYGAGALTNARDSVHRGFKEGKVWRVTSLTNVVSRPWPAGTQAAIFDSIAAYPNAMHYVIYDVAGKESTSAGGSQTAIGPVNNTYFAYHTAPGGGFMPRMPFEFDEGYNSVVVRGLMDIDKNGPAMLYGWDQENMSKIYWTDNSFALKGIGGGQGPLQFKTKEYGDGVEGDTMLDVTLTRYRAYWPNEDHPTTAMVQAPPRGDSQCRVDLFANLNMGPGYRMPMVGCTHKRDPITGLVVDTQGVRIHNNVVYNNINRPIQTTSGPTAFDVRQSITIPGPADNGRRSRTVVVLTDNCDIPQPWDATYCSDVQSLFAEDLLHAETSTPYDTAVSADSLWYGSTDFAISCRRTDDPISLWGTYGDQCPITDNSRAVGKDTIEQVRRMSPLPESPYPLPLLTMTRGLADTMNQGLGSNYYDTGTGGARFEFPVGASFKADCSAGWVGRMHPQDSASLIELRDTTGTGSVLVDRDTVVVAAPASGTACTDSDGDNVPDAWETTHHGNLTTTTSFFDDQDSDGWFDGEEWLNDTDPNVVTNNDGSEGTAPPPTEQTTCSNGRNAYLLPLTATVDDGQTVYRFPSDSVVGLSSGGVIVQSDLTDGIIVSTDTLSSSWKDSTYIDSVLSAWGESREPCSMTIP